MLQHQVSIWAQEADRQYLTDLVIDETAGVLDPEEGIQEAHNAIGRLTAEE
jgi:hypothetical protein